MKKVYIKATAIKSKSGRITVGRDYEDVAHKVYEPCKVTVPIFYELDGYEYITSDHGFLTNEGEFVYPREAAAIAAAGQLKPRRATFSRKT